MRLPRSLPSRTASSRAPVASTGFVGRSSARAKTLVLPPGTTANAGTGFRHRIHLIFVVTALAGLAATRLRATSGDADVGDRERGAVQTAPAGL